MFLPSIISHAVHFLEHKSNVNYNGYQIISKTDLYKTFELIQQILMIEFINSEKLTELAFEE